MDFIRVIIKHITGNISKGNKVSMLLVRCIWCLLYLWWPQWRPQAETQSIKVYFYAVMTKGFSQCHIFSVLYTFCCFSFYLAFFVRVCDLVKNNGKKSSFKHLQESQYNIWFKSTIVNITVLSKDSWCEVWEASWPRIQNVYLMISKPLSYHKTKDILEDHQSEDFFYASFWVE